MVRVCVHPHEACIQQWAQEATSRRGTSQSEAASAYYSRVNEAGSTRAVCYGVRHTAEHRYGGGLHSQAQRLAGVGVVAELDAEVLLERRHARLHLEQDGGSRRHHVGDLMGRRQEVMTRKAVQAYCSCTGGVCRA